MVKVLFVVSLVEVERLLMEGIVVLMMGVELLLTVKAEDVRELKVDVEVEAEIETGGV